MSRFCRFELLLPLRFNDGQPVPRALLALTADDIQRRFGAVSWESQVIAGLWRESNMVYRGQLNRLFVDAEDTPDNRHFFQDLKNQLKERFAQLDIWVTVHPIELL